MNIAAVLCKDHLWHDHKQHADSIAQVNESQEDAKIIHDAVQVVCWTCSP